MINFVYTTCETEMVSVADFSLKNRFAYVNTKKGKGNYELTLTQIKQKYS